ncbi:MAG: glycosyltransferase family 2 protein [Paludibacteraceae bacterium]|nr:glycosyltransferase family 2 protein [Paludibacteraceae bacterium]
MKKEQPKVCVIMPVYNGEKTIKRALTSLLMQTYTNWECVVVNDGSTDGTQSILDELTDPRFKVFSLPKNVGRGAARQVCLEHADGEFLTYLDADDFYHKDKIRLQVETFETDPQIDLVSCGMLVFDDNDEPINIRGGRYHKITHFCDGDNLRVVPVCSMVKLPKALTIQYNSFLNAGEDVDYFSRYLDGGTLVSMEEILHYYYVGTTTYSKVLSYTYNDMKRGIYLAKRRLSSGIRLALSAFAKLLIYALLIPILGVDFFLNKRGHACSEEEIQQYKQTLNAIQQ